MTTLTIKPLEYKGRRLQELGDKVVTSVYPLMDDFRTLRETSLRTLLRNERDILSELVKWHQVRLTPPYNLAFSQQIGEFLSQYGENVLGVTQLPATLVHVDPELDSWSQSLFVGELLVQIQNRFCIEGRAPNGTQTAYVSTYRSQYRDLDS